MSQSVRQVDEAFRAAHISIVQAFLRKGDLITHERCGGTIEEHIYDGVSAYSHGGICGLPTRDTMRVHHMEGSASENRADDIAPANIRYINHCEIASLPHLPEFYERLAGGAVTVSRLLGLSERMARSGGLVLRGRAGGRPQVTMARKTKKGKS